MHLLRIYSPLQIIVLFIFVHIADGNRIKRRIIFEDDNGQDGRFSKNSDCITPSKEQGICTLVPDCQPLRRLTNWNRLRPHMCGFEGSELQVCCPYSEDKNEDPRIIPTRRTMRTTRRTTPTKRRTTPIISPVIPTTRNLFGNVQKSAFLPERCGVAITTDTRIFGGREANRGSWPWMAAVFVKKRNGDTRCKCGGSLVTNRHVITAAHCVVSRKSSITMRPWMLSVRLGAHDLRKNESSAIDMGIIVVKRHERYNPKTNENDIAVLTLNRAIHFTPQISPICLPYDSLRSEDLTNRKATVTGFGKVAYNGPSSNVLMQATLDIPSQEVCRKAFEREAHITSVHVCAGIYDTGEKDACVGDSGGPLMTLGKEGNYYLVGTVSFGKLCGEPGYYGVYTRTTEFLDWLSRNLVY